MNVTIEIPDDRLDDFIKHGQDALTDNDLHSIMVKVIDKYVGEHIGEAFITYNMYHQATPTKLLEDLVKNIDISKDCDNIKKSITDFIENDHDIVADIMLRAISKSLFDVSRDSYWLEEAIRNKFRQYSNN